MKPLRFFLFLGVVGLLIAGTFAVRRLSTSDAFSHVEDLGTDTNGFNNAKVGEAVWAAWDSPNLEPNRPVVVERLEFIRPSPKIEILEKYVMDRTYPGNAGGTLTGHEWDVWGPHSVWKREALSPAIGATLVPTDLPVPKLYFVVRMRPIAPGKHFIQGWKMTYRDLSGRRGTEEYVGRLFIDVK